MFTPKNKSLSKPHYPCFLPLKTFRVIKRIELMAVLIAVSSLPLSIYELHIPYNIKYINEILNFMLIISFDN